MNVTVIIYNIRSDVIRWQISNFISLKVILLIFVGIFHRFRYINVFIICDLENVG